MEPKKPFALEIKLDTFNLFILGKRKREVDVQTTDLTDEKSEVTNRAQWGRQMEFFLSCVGYAVGLGNLWRFPYLCLRHGGGAFLIPYLIYLIVCGMSLFLMETAIGQSTGISTVRIFNMVPFFQGLGWSMVFASAFLSVYYNIVIAYSLYYLVMSFNWILPWSHCDNPWNTPNCYTYANMTDQRNSPSVIENSSSIMPTMRSAAEEFWLFNVLEISPDINTLGGVNWKLAVSLTASWLLTFVCMCKGIRSSGKVVYVTALAPYFLLTVTIVRGCTLPGAWKGIKFYILPEWNRLTDINVWIAAATQIFYSLGPAWGGLITFASYNKYRHNVQRDAILVPLICGGTSIYAAFAIFSVVGHMMHVTGQDSLENLTLQGPGLAFVAYPQALTALPGSAVWSVLFFLMLITLGIDGQFATLESVTTGLIDRFPRVVGRHKVLLTLLVCVVEFLLGFILTTRAGFYYFELMDSYSTAFSVVTIGLLETLVISYLYGARRLLRDIEAMIGPMWKSTKWWWTIAWCVLNPILILTIVVSTCVTHVTQAEEKRKQFPDWAITVGWIVASLSFIQVPILAIYAIIKHRGDWRKLFFPNDEWRQLIERRQAICQAKENSPIVVAD